MKDISEAALECSVRIMQWGATKSDREEGRRLANENNANQKAYRVVKTLINDEYLKPVAAAARRIRKAHQKYTLPWLHDGTGLLPVTLYTKCTKELLQLEGEFRHEVTKLAQKVDEIRDDTSWLGDGREPLPTAEAIESMFDVKVSMRPVRTAGDFRVDMSADMVEAIKQDYKEEITDQVAASTASVYRRVVGVVEDMVEGLERHGKVEVGNKKPNYFKDAVVQNVGELSEILDDLNVTGDPEFTEFSSALRTRLTMMDGQSLREDDNLRKSVLEDAREILDTARNRSGMAGFLGLEE